MRSSDRVQIEQVLLNLVRNAMDSMADVPLVDRRIAIESRSDQNCAYISVTDKGSGMTPQQVAQVFTPFFTTKTNGMGLGLSISKSIIEAHSGILSVESELGKGTSFTFTLPLTLAEERA